MRKSRVSISMQFVIATGLILILEILDIMLKGVSPIIRASVRLLYGLVMAGLITYILRTLKIRNYPIKYKKATKVIGIVWIIALLVLFLIFCHIVNNLIGVFGAKTLVSDTMMALSAGFFEEFICRGLLFNAFLKMFKNNNLKCTLTACSSALFFGIFHLLNLINGQALTPTIQQVIYAFVFGVILASVRTVTNTLIWPVILHFLFDWQAGMSISHIFSGIVAWPTFLIVWGLFLILGLAFLISFDRSANQSPHLNSLTQTKYRNSIPSKIIDTCCHPCYSILKSTGLK